MGYLSNPYSMDQSGPMSYEEMLKQKQMEQSPGMQMPQSSLSADYSGKPMESEFMAPGQSFQSGQSTPMTQPSQGINTGGVLAGAGTGAVAGAGAGLPGVALGAGIGAAGSFLTQEMANDAANERNKRDNLAKVASDHAHNQTEQINNLLSAYRAALIR